MKDKDKHYFDALDDLIKFLKMNGLWEGTMTKHSIQDVVGCLKRRRSNWDDLVALKPGAAVNGQKRDLRALSKASSDKGQESGVQ